MKTRITYQIAYQTVGKYFADKTGSDFILEYCGEASRVKAMFHGISLYFNLESISDNEIVFSLQIGQFIKPARFFSFFRSDAQVVAQETVNKLLESFEKSPAVTIDEGRTIRVKLSEIGKLKWSEIGKLKWKLKWILQNTTLNDVQFEESGINVDVTCKKYVTWKCPRCHTDIDSESDVCPACGYVDGQLTPEEEKYQFDPDVAVFIHMNSKQVQLKDRWFEESIHDFHE